MAGLIPRQSLGPYVPVMSMLHLLTSCFVFSFASSLPPWKNYDVETNEIIEKDDFDLNTIPDLIVDFALAELRHYFKDRNETTIAIPDVNTSFDENWLGVHVRGSLGLRTGTFRNPATIIRKGATHVKRVNDSIIFSVTIGFSEMSVRYEDYDLDLIGLQERGAAEVWIRENSVALQVSVTYAPHCVVKIKRLEFTEIGEVETDVTGLGIFDSLADDIVAWIIAHYRASFQSLVEKAVQDRIDKELVHTTFCKRQYYFKKKLEPKLVEPEPKPEPEPAILSQIGVGTVKPLAPVIYLLILGGLINRM